MKLLENLKVGLIFEVFLWRSGGLGQQKADQLEETIHENNRGENQAVGKSQEEMREEKS